MGARNLLCREAMTDPCFSEEGDEVHPSAPDVRREIAHMRTAGIAEGGGVAGAGSICSEGAVMAASRNLGRSSTPDFIVWNS